MIIPITDSNFQECCKGLERALLNTTLGDFWDLPSLRDKLSRGKVLGFFQPDSGYSGICSIGIYPKVKSLVFFWSGKDPANKTPVDYSEADEYLQASAERLNCKYILCDGRVGWKTVLEPLGYTLDTHSYIREIQYV
mgnify:CR=1 FL=1